MYIKGMKTSEKTVDKTSVVSKRGPGRPKKTEGRLSRPMFVRVTYTDELAFNQIARKGGFEPHEFHRALIRAISMGKLVVDPVMLKLLDVPPGKPGEAGR